MDLELQQRSVEYSSVFKRSHRGDDDFRAGLFACMPVFKPSSTFLLEGSSADDAAVVEGQGQVVSTTETPAGAGEDSRGINRPPAQSSNDAITLLDLLGDSSFAPPPPTSHGETLL